MGKALFFALALSSLSACMSNEGGARADFSRDFSCPKERITTTARADLHMSIVNPPPQPQPSAEVRADPGRLALWRKQQQDVTDAWNDSCTDFFEVSGCDHHVLYCCHHPSTSKGGIRMDSVMCSQYAFPPDAGSHGPR